VSYKPSFNVKNAPSNSVLTLNKLKADHPRLLLLIGGDGLFSDGTVTKHVLSLDMHTLFTCKPSDHRYLME
jgi:hypothetical protein